MIGNIYHNANSAAGNAKLREIVANYEMARIPVVKVHYANHGAWAQFENGDIWRVLGANDRPRGYRCNVAYIERSISFDTYRTVICPAMINHPYSAIHLWGEGNLYIVEDFSMPFLKGD